MSAHRKAGPLDIAILGTRGVPAGYGGFETFAEELATRLVARGHAVTVFGRPGYVDPQLREFRGVRLRVVSCVRHKYLETVTHTARSVLSTLPRRYDALLICNAANAFLTGIPRLLGTPVVLNVDGIERMRKKWNWAGKLFYLLGERLSTFFPSRIVTDAKTIQDYYRRRFGCRTDFIPYGASTQAATSEEVPRELGLGRGGYLLYVSRLEPENNAHLLLEAYKRARVEIPLALVGSAPYSRRYIDALHEAARGQNVLLPGAIYGAGYRELLTHCRCYFQATEVGGTHPALIEAMGVGALVVAHDTPENREVLHDAGILLDFRDIDALAECIRRVCRGDIGRERLGAAARQRVARHYDWDAVTDQYEALFRELAA